MRSIEYCRKVQLSYDLRFQVASNFFNHNPNSITTKQLISGYSFPTPCCPTSKKKYNAYQLLCPEHWYDNTYFPYIYLAKGFQRHSNFKEEE